MPRQNTSAPPIRQPFPSSLATAFSLVAVPTSPVSACAALGVLLRQMRGDDSVRRRPDTGYEPRPLQLKPPRWEAQIGRAS